MITCTIYAYLGGAWTDITASTTPSGMRCSFGLQGNKDTDRMARGGQLTFDLHNNDNEFTPGHVSAHADWGKGTLVRVDFSKGITKTKFIGRISTIKLRYAYNNNIASITALDWVYTASQLPLDIPLLQTGQRADEIISAILASSPVPPESQDLQSGTRTFTYAFHDNTVKTSAYTEITKAVMSEWGYCYVKGDGTLVFEAAGGRSTTQKQLSVLQEVSGFLLQEDGDFILQEDGDKLVLEPYDITLQDAEASAIDDINLVYGEHIVNRVDVQVYPYQPGGNDALVYKSEEYQYVPTGETVSFRVQFTDPNSRNPIAASAPSVEQHTLLHMENNNNIGISGVLDDGDLNILQQASDGLFYPRVVFVASGGSYTTGKFSQGWAGNGTSDYIYSPSQEKFNFRDEDFTVDWWEYRNASSSGRGSVSRNYFVSGLSPYVFGYSDGTVLRAFITSNGSTWDIANNKSMGTITTGAWVHLAITREGDTFRTFKNGVFQDGWTSSGTVLASNGQLSIFSYNGTYTNGVIDEFRMVKGRAMWTGDFTPPAREHAVSGLNWALYTQTRKNGTEITGSATATASFGGAGLDFTITNSSASNGYLNMDVYAKPLESLSPVSCIVEDATSISDYDYHSERIDMRLESSIVYPKQIAEDIIAARKDPAVVLNSVSMFANKNDINEALFMDCDLGDLVRVNESLSGYNALNHIQSVTWQATPKDGGALVYFTWALKEQ